MLPGDKHYFFPIVGNDLHSISTDPAYGSLLGAPAQTGDRYAGYLILDRLTVGGGAVLVTEDYIRATSVDASSDSSIDSPDLTAYLSPLDFGTLVPMEDNGKHYAVPVWYALALPDGAIDHLSAKWFVTDVQITTGNNDLLVALQNQFCSSIMTTRPSLSQQSCNFALAPDSLAGYLKKMPSSKPVLLASLAVPTLEEPLPDTAAEIGETDPAKPLFPANQDYPKTAPGLDPIYEYDKLDRVTRIIDPVGSLSYQYDPVSDVLLSIYDSATPAPLTPYTHFSYDGLNRLTRIEYPNGMVCAYEYGTDFRLAGITYTMNGSIIDSFAYSYDEVGNISRIDRPTWHVVYGYDLNNQLISADYEGSTDLSDEWYEYDPVGNRTASHLSSFYLYDELNRLLEDEKHWYEWDNNGNMIVKGNKADGSFMLLGYDPENKLRRVEKSDGAVIAYAYDAKGRRVIRSVNGTEERFHYDGEDVLFDTDSSDNITVRYVNLPNTVDQKVYATMDGQHYTYLRDHLGTIWKVLDSQGNVVKGYTYDSFGQVKGQSGALPNRYTYTGREIEPESGLYYYRARFYYPKSGTYIAEDKYIYLSLNRYIYTMNNPVNNIDPYGLITIISENIIYTKHYKVCASLSNPAQLIPGTPLACVEWNVVGKEITYKEDDCDDVKTKTETNIENFQSYLAFYDPIETTL